MTGSPNAPLLSPDDAVVAWGGLPELQTYEPGSGVPPKFIGGTLSQVQSQLEQLANDLDVSEIIIQDVMTDHAARLHSYELLAALIG